MDVNCLSCSVCCNRRPETGWVVNNRHLLLTVLGLKSKITAPAEPVSGEGSLPGTQTATVPLSSQGRGDEGALWGLFRCLVAKSHVWLFVAPWTVARQAPLSMGFPRKEYWVSFTRALILFIRAALSWPTRHPKAPPPNAITLAVRISTCEFLGDTSIQCMA